MEIILKRSLGANARGSVVVIPEQRKSIGKEEYEEYIERCIEQKILVYEDVEALCDEYNLDLDKFLKFFSAQ